MTKGTISLCQSDGGKEDFGEYKRNSNCRRKNRVTKTIQFDVEGRV
jgi:hypothetical protein